MWPVEHIKRDGPILCACQRLPDEVSMAGDLPKPGANAGAILGFVTDMVIARRGSSGSAHGLPSVGSGFRRPSSLNRPYSAPRRLPDRMPCPWPPTRRSAFSVEEALH